MSEVYIKCFQTADYKYFYDRYLDSVVNVTEEEYIVLKEIEKNKSGVNHKLMRRFIDNGLLKETVLSRIQHPETNNIVNLSENKMQSLILQVTQQCNLRCDYCIYSGNYYNRVHSNEIMTFSIAKKAIDFYLQRSKETQELSLSFYGGEPLLEFDLIKECVAYILNNSDDRPVRFNMTTNFTLIKREMFDFFIGNKFNILVSLDGEKESHDVNRKTVDGKGTFDLVMQNLMDLKKHNTLYYQKYVAFNSVITSKNNLQKTYEFFTTSEVFDVKQVSLNKVDDTEIIDDAIVKISEENQIVNKFESIKLMLSMIGQREWDKKGELLRASVAEIELLYEHLHRRGLESEERHHSGPCLPGIRRLFVTANGKLYPCERVSESNDQMSIGSLEEGFDYNNIDLFINHGQIIEKECLECWNIRRCLFCLSSLDKNNGNVSKELLLENCERMRELSLGLLYDVCTLVELGYRGNDNFKFQK